MHLFREYMLVGGMPQSVVAYIESHGNFEKSGMEKRDILDLYRDDIKKAAKHYNSKVSAIFENIPTFLSTHEKKIVLNTIDTNGVFSRYDEPLFWLDDSMVCNLCYRCNEGMLYENVIAQMLASLGRKLYFTPSTIPRNIATSARIHFGVTCTFLFLSVVALNVEFFQL